MRALIAIVVTGALLFPAVSQSAVFYLKDGSTLQGVFVRLNNDTLYVKTSFGVLVPIHKSLMNRIDFAGIPTGVAPAIGITGRQPGAQDAVPLQSAELGTLQVVFDRFSLSSEVIVHRNKHRAEIERANAIESFLIVDGKKQHSEVDSVTDKVIRKGPETLIRNKMQPSGYKVVLAPGARHCEFGIGNTFVGAYESSFPDGLLEKRLIQDDFVIEPGHTTQIRIGLKKKYRGLGASYLYVID